jgi:acetolactate synthase-1/2/3 large subunit
MSGGERIADVLARHGVRFLFALCGGHISPILVAAKRRGIRVVDVRHEATAVFAADAVARLTGVPGVAAVTAGPGATNTLTAVKNAQLAESPVVVLGGATASVLKGRGSLQDIDQLALMRPHVKSAVSVGRVRDLPAALTRAFAVACSGVPGPVFVECPVDLLYEEAVVRKWYAIKSSGGGGLLERAQQWYLRWHLDSVFGGNASVEAATPAAVEAPQPSREVVAQAAAALARAERPVLVLGSQAMLDPANAPLLRTAVERLGIPAFLSGMARGLLGASHPQQLRHRRKEALREADLVILAGTPCDFRLDYGRHIGRRATLVSANRSHAQLRKNRRPDLAAPAAPDLFLRALAESAPGAARCDAWLASLRERDAVRDREIEEQALAACDGLNPLRLCAALDRSLEDASVIVADGGDFVATASYIVRPRRPLSWLDPGVFGTLGVGAGFALGAKLVRPEADVVVLYGDGSLGYSLIEMDTFARHGLGVVAVVGNDAGWAQIAREQVEVLGDAVGTLLAPTDYHCAAAGLGAEGFLLTQADDIGRTLSEAREAARGGRPALVNARIGRTDFRKGSISM